MATNEEVILEFLKDGKVHTTMEIARELTLMEEKWFLVSTILYRLGREGKVRIVKDPKVVRLGDVKWQIS